MEWNVLLNKQQLDLQLLILFIWNLSQKTLKNLRLRASGKQYLATKTFDLEYAAEYGQYIDWKLASHNTLLNELVLQGFLEKLDIMAIVKDRQLSEDFLYKNAEFFKS